MEILKKPGIYLIYNLANQRVYVGQSINVLRRLKEHRKNLKKQCHVNPNLQNAFNKYGEDKFVFRSVEYCEVENLTIREEYWIGQFNSMNLSRGYNLRPASKHESPSKETRAKISAAGIGRIKSEETLAKLSAANKGKVLSEEHRAKVSEARKGKTHSEETRAKMSAAAKGNVLNQERLAKMSAANKGTVLSEEHRAKISESNKGKPKSEEQRAKMSAATKLQWERKRNESC